MAGDDVDRVFEMVLRRFADCPNRVLDLARQSSSFRDMCYELRDAERAMAHILTAAVPHRAERLSECQGWIERLTTEMREALAQAHMAPARSPGHRGVHDAP